MSHAGDAARPVLVTGTVAFDDIETPFGKANNVIGGSATYFGAAASFFTPVRLVAVVGGDFPVTDLGFLQQRGVDLSGLEVQEAAKSFRWAGRYHYDLNNRDTLGTWLNVLETFDPKVPEAYRDSRIVFLANLDPTIQRKVLDQVDDPELVVMDTMNFWIEGARSELDKTLQLADVLIVNDAEARQLADEPNIVKAAQAIRKMGPDTLIVKKGEHGALMFHGGGVFSAPAYPLEFVFDPTGAGDTFAGGFVGYLAKHGWEDERILRQAVVHGSALASFCVEKFSVDRLRDVTPPDLDARYKAFRALTAFD